MNSVQTLMFRLEDALEFLNIDYYWTSEEDYLAAMHDKVHNVLYDYLPLALEDEFNRVQTRGLPWTEDDIDEAVRQIYTYVTSREESEIKPCPNTDYWQVAQDLGRKIFNKVNYWYEPRLIVRREPFLYRIWFENEAMKVERLDLNTDTEAVVLIEPNAVWLDGIEIA